MAATLLAVVLAVLASAPARAALVDAIEFYNPALDHYFVTADPVEIGKLDNGVFPGWQRTRLSFKVSDNAGSLSAGAPVCRFYGLPSAGLDSHFYSASAAECAAVQQRFANAWQLESSAVFAVQLPAAATGACPADSIPVYRAWNNRIDSNHRYTTDPDVQSTMLARGYVAEGYGTPAVAMCSPQPTAAAAPACTLTASVTAPLVGTSLTLSASCTNNPTVYAWSGCVSNGPTCTATASFGGTQTYVVVASNAAGVSPQSRLDVNWVGAAPPVQETPTCSIAVTTSTPVPVAGAPAVLAAICTFDPQRYNWSGPGCAGFSGRVCPTTSAAPGMQAYAVSATNSGGTGPAAGATLNWQATAPAPASNDFCNSYPSALRTRLGWSNARLFSTDYADPTSFRWNGVWAVELQVPVNASGTQAGRLAVGEYNAQPTAREITVSRSACDFRPVDPAGVNGPIANFTGTSATAFITFGSPAGYTALTPGQTYYLNIRNWQFESGTISCAPELGYCHAFVDVILPR